MMLKSASKITHISQIINNVSTFFENIFIAFVSPTILNDQMGITKK